MTNLKTHRDDYQYYSGESGEVVKLTLSYYKDARVRGIYLYIHTVTLKQEGTFKSESFLIFGDNSARLLCAPLPRKSPKVMAALAGRLDPIIPALVEAYRTDKNSAVQMATDCIQGVN
jgi:hypothetical protein